MKVRVYVSWKGKFKLMTIGKLSSRGIFHFRSNQVRKACYRQLVESFQHYCPGGTLTIIKDSIGEKYLNCYANVALEKQNSRKHILVYRKPDFRGWQRP